MKIQKRNYFIQELLSLVVKMENLNRLYSRHVRKTEYIDLKIINLKQEYEDI